MSTMKRHVSTTLLAVLAPIALQQAYANTIVLDSPIGQIEGQPSWTARQSSDYRQDTGAEVALPAGPDEFGTFVVPEFSTPSYTLRQLNPWWQADLRVRRDITTVAALPCEGYAVSGGLTAGPGNASGGQNSNAGTDASGLAVNGADTDLTVQTPEQPPARIACNSDFDLSGAWLLVSDLPLPNDPWLASVAEDPSALISRFPIISNGYTQTQVASINRSGRYLRIQFPPGSQRALAIEQLSVRGANGISKAMLNLNDEHDALFVETRLLIDSLSDFQGIADFTHEEFSRLHGRGRQLESAARTSASVAKRVSRLEGKLKSAISVLKRTEVISQLRGPARATRHTLERIRQAALQIKPPAKRAEEKLRKAQRSFRKFNSRVRQSQGILSAGIAWSSSEETAVSGLYHSHVVDADNPTTLIPQPQSTQLEGYSGFRNDQIEQTQLNDRTQEIGDTTKTINDAIQRTEDAIGSAQFRLGQVDQQLARIETALDLLLTPLREIDTVLGQRVCVPLTSSCFSVNDVLTAIRDGKNLVGLGILEDIVFDILDPVIDEITRPLTAALPSVPTFPAIVDIDLPDTSLLLGQLTDWDEVVNSLGDLLKTPSYFFMAEASEVIDTTRETDMLWQELNERAGDAQQVSP